MPIIPKLCHYSWQFIAKYIVCCIRVFHFNLTDCSFRITDCSIKVSRSYYELALVSALHVATLQYGNQQHAPLNYVHMTYLLTL